MNRGSLPALNALTQMATRFNEAPIHESGKSLLNRSSCFVRNSFNEAPIHESGK